MIVEMRHACIDKLKLQQDLGQHDVVKALVPDMSDWVPMWTKRAGNSFEVFIESVAVHRAIGVVDLLCVLARRLGHRQS